MQRKISIMDNNGANGKTFVASNLGIALSNLGKKVLLVDLDPQANLTQNFGITESLFTSYRALTEEGVFEVTRLRENLDMVPSCADLVGCELELYTKARREYALSDLLNQSLFRIYDFIIIDTAPSSGLLTLNALVAADEVIVPIIVQKNPLDNFDSLISFIEKANVLLKNKSISLRFLVNGLKNEELITVALTDKARHLHANNVFNTVVHYEAHLQNKIKSIALDYNLKHYSVASEDFEYLAKEIINQ